MVRIDSCAESPPGQIIGNWKSDRNSVSIEMSRAFSWGRVSGSDCQRLALLAWAKAPAQISARDVNLEDAAD